MDQNNTHNTSNIRSFIDDAIDNFVTYWYEKTKDASVDGLSEEQLWELRKHAELNGTKLSGIKDSVDLAEMLNSFFITDSESENDDVSWNVKTGNNDLSWEVKYSSIFYDRSTN